MEGLEEKNLSSGDTFLKYGQVFFALLFLQFLDVEFAIFAIIIFQNHH